MAFGRSQSCHRSRAMFWSVIVALVVGMFGALFGFA